MLSAESWSLRARDCEAAPFELEVMAELLDASPGELRRLAGALRRQAHRLVWRRRVAYRNAALSRLLRYCERAMGPSYSGRAKGEDGGWTLHANVDGKPIPVITVRPSKLQKLADFGKPTAVDVLLPEHVDAQLLRRLFDAPPADDCPARAKK